MPVNFIVFLAAKSYDDVCRDSEQCKPLLDDKPICSDDRCTCDVCVDRRGL